ncbi:MULTISPECIES: hypothetical protein [Bacillus]|uniref:hypothetical protein n=1 Tax=Bacillus TaxID=1386 RepID=UPI00057BD034|nr:MULTISPECIES: hypothetical protein [Bacillus]MCY8056480.1 hypothetical protein [Bacillus inaquosorum]
MPKNKVESIEEQIKRLKEKKKAEIEKLEKATGKMFLDAFNLNKEPIEHIELFIEELKSKHSTEEQLKEEKEHVGFTNN